MTGQVWNLHTLLVAHAVGVMSHAYCCGKQGRLVIYNLAEGKCDCSLFCDIFEYIKFGILSKDKVALSMPKSCELHISVLMFVKVAMLHSVCDYLMP